MNKLLCGGVEIEAENYIFAAGAGNGELMDAIGIDDLSQQLRPLHQLIVRGDLPDFYSVCIGNTPKPPVVTTTHTDSKDRKIWWIGGDIAEAKGVARSEDEQSKFGRDTMQRLLPWMDWENYEFFTARANRAEPLTGTGDRPPGAYCRKINNVMVTWPTKLALAPNLADQVLKNLPKPTYESPGDKPGLPRPEVGRAPWDL